MKKCFEIGIAIHLLFANINCKPCNWRNWNGYNVNASAAYPYLRDFLLYPDKAAAKKDDVAEEKPKKAPAKKPAAKKKAEE